MPTVIGTIFFSCGIYCFFLNEGGLLPLLLVSSIFEAASAVNIAGRGIQPYYVVSIFIIAKALANRFLGVSLIRPPAYRNPLLVFGFIAVGSAFVLPVLFAGTPIYSSKMSIDDPFFFRAPLALGLDNFAQAGFLACSIAVVLSVPTLRFSVEKVRRAYIFAFWLLALIVLAQSACQLLGITFPDFLIRNNPGYGLFELNDYYIVRKPGSFSEASLAGAALVMFTVGFITEYLAGRGRAGRLLLALIVSGLVSSTGSLLVTTLFVIALFFRYPPFRLPWHIKIHRARRIAWLVFLLLGPLTAALLASPSYRDTLVAFTLSKGETGSFLNRSTADLYGLRLFLDSHLIGVGLGSNRASSMLSTLLSDVGIAGALAFAVFFHRLMTGLPKDYTWLKWGGYALLLNSFVDVPDVTFPMLWVALSLAASFSAKEASGLTAGEFGVASSSVRIKPL